MPIFHRTQSQTHALAHAHICLQTKQTETQYNTVVADMRLPEGQLFGLPVVLDTDREDIKVGDFVELVDPNTGAHGVLQVCGTSRVRVCCVCARKFMLFSFLSSVRALMKRRRARKLSASRATKETWTPHTARRSRVSQVLGKRPCVGAFLIAKLFDPSTSTFLTPVARVTRGALRRLRASGFRIAASRPRSATAR